MDTSTLEKLLDALKDEQKAKEAEPKVYRAWCGFCGQYVFQGDNFPCGADKPGRGDCPLASSQHKAELVPLSEKTKRDGGVSASTVIPLTADGVKELLSRPGLEPPEEVPVSMPDTATLLPSSPEARKVLPICTGVLDYFPRALAAVSAASKQGSEQHNPGKPLFWDKTKSTDHADCILRHLIDRGTMDTDGIRHSAKAAWRALALLETELEKEGSQ